MADPITDGNSSFFSDSGVSPIKKQSNVEAPIRVATQELTKGAIKDNKTTSDNIPQISYSNAKSEPKSNPQISFSDAVSQAKAAASAINPQAIRSMNEADAIKYAQSSISDLEQKMAQVASLSAMASMPKASSSQNQQAPVSANNTQVSNNVSNVTNIMSDYLRNLRADYEKTPQWRAEVG